MLLFSSTSDKIIEHVGQDLLQVKQLCTQQKGLTTPCDSKQESAPQSVENSDQIRYS